MQPQQTIEVCWVNREKNDMKRKVLTEYKTFRMKPQQSTIIKFVSDRLDQNESDFIRECLIFRFQNDQRVKEIVTRI